LPEASVGTEICNKADCHRLKGISSTPSPPAMRLHEMAIVPNDSWSRERKARSEDTGAAEASMAEN